MPIRSKLARRGLAIALGVLVVAGSWWSTVGHDRATPPLEKRRVARAVRERAMQDGAGAHSAQAFLEGEALLQRTELAFRRQELRLLPFRNFTAVADSLDSAIGVLEGASTRARQSLRSASESAAARIAEATHELSLARDAADVLPLARKLRPEVARGDGRLSEARSLLRDGRAMDATRAADLALEAGRSVNRQASTLTERFLDPGQLAIWDDWIEQTIDESRTGGRITMVVIKDRHELRLYRDGRLVRSFDVDLGAASVNDKRRIGDRATPEGRYRVIGRLDIGASRYHRALVLDYPNSEDLARAGGPSAAAELGGDIEIHGAGGRDSDWTDGCVAVENAEMDWLFAQAPVGTPVTIVGGDGRGPYADLARRLNDRAR